MSFIHCQLWIKLQFSGLFQLFCFFLPSPVLLLGLNHFRSFCFYFLDVLLEEVFVFLVSIQQIHCYIEIFCSLLIGWHHNLIEQALLLFVQSCVVLGWAHYSFVVWNLFWRSFMGGRFFEIFKEGVGLFGLRFPPWRQGGWLEISMVQ